jgi:ABC-type sugar transport system ATPase subunit
MVFQNYALYPHMTVFENIAFGLRVRRIPKREINRRVEEIGRVLGLAELSPQAAAASGGQRQRVAMGRAIVREPSVFLMDEPLSNLDARLRVQMRAEVSRIQHELEATTIYVTHDQVEAMTMGDRIAVMRNGILQQTGHPQHVYDHPANLFVGSFIGSPPMNLVQARLDSRNGDVVVLVGAQELVVPAEVARDRPALSRYAGRTVGLGIRPEHVRDPARRRRRKVAPARRGAGDGALGRGARAPRRVSRARADRGSARGRRRRDGARAARVRGARAADDRHRTVRDIRAPSGPARRSRSRSTRATDFFDLETGLAIYGE